MKKSWQILLYGNSLILGAIGSSLRRCPEFVVTTLAFPRQEKLESGTLKPDILIFDSETAQAGDIFYLLKTNPKLLLLGISSGANLVQVWSGRQLRDMSTKGLLDLIKSEVKNLSVF